MLSSLWNYRLQSILSKRFYTSTLRAFLLQTCSRDFSCDYIGWTPVCLFMFPSCLSYSIGPFPCRRSPNITLRGKVFPPRHSPSAIWGVDVTPMWGRYIPIASNIVNVLNVVPAFEFQHLCKWTRWLRVFTLMFTLHELVCLNAAFVTCERLSGNGSYDNCSKLSSWVWSFRVRCSRYLNLKYWINRDYILYLRLLACSS